jgi:hypothetical protein
MLTTSSLLEQESSIQNLTLDIELPFKFGKYVFGFKGEMDGFTKSPDVFFFKRTFKSRNTKAKLHLSLQKYH